MKTLFTFAIAVFFQLAANSMPSSFADDFGQLRSNLYIVAPDSSTVLMDGSLTQYYSDYSNDIDGMDARKMSNFSENWGMLRNDKVYVIERRHTIEANDSIFFKMWNMRIITYRIELIASGLEKEGRQAVLEDKYLKKSTPVNLDGTTYIDFSVTDDADSKASDRFRIVISSEPVVDLPLGFTSVSASEKNNLVSINWATTNENNVKQLGIERSVNGRDFIELNSVVSKNNPVNMYHWIDASPNQGANYYRIAGRGLDGKVIYSEEAKVYVSKRANEAINVFPNPATAGNFNLQMINQKAGLYKLRLINSSGQVFVEKTIQYAGGSSVEKIYLLPTIPKGVYRLEVKTPEGDERVITVVF